MNRINDFDTLWNRRAAAVANTHCPLDSDRLEQMLTHAMQSVDRQSEGAALSMESSDPQHDNGNRRVFRPRWLAAPLAAAAALALVLIPTRSHAAAPRTVTYGDQQVKFICNHQCEADGVIGSLDQYLHTL